MDIFSNQITSQIVSIIVAAACGWLGAKVTTLRKRDEALYCGMRVLLRASLYEAYDEYVTQQRPLSLERKREIIEAWEAYDALGGNGTGKQLYDELCEIPIKTEH